METILKFNSENPDDNTDLKIMLQANDMQYVLFEFLVNTRKSVLRRGYLGELNESQYEIAEKLFDELNRLVKENNINIEL